VEALRARFNGALLREGAEGYDTARKVWNGAIDRKPALIACCTGPSDIVEAVRFAREQDLPISVKGAGHAVAGHAVGEGGGDGRSLCHAGGVGRRVVDLGGHYSNLAALLRELFGAR
jgi:FAD/FMN-containing dehydrogenase